MCGSECVKNSQSTVHLGKSLFCVLDNPVTIQFPTTERKTIHKDVKGKPAITLLHKTTLASLKTHLLLHTKPACRS